MATESIENIKPIPDTSRDTPFWEGLKSNQFRLYKCQDCNTFYYPEQKCLNCKEPNMEWVPTSGRGKIYTFIIMHQLYNPAFQKELPYNVSIIELDEGPMIMSNISDSDNEDIEIGKKVEVVFDQVNEDLTTHSFKIV